VQTTTSSDDQKNLGPAVASYGSRRRAWREAWIWPLPGVILACVLIIAGLDWYYYGYTQYGPTAAQSWSLNWLFWGILVGILTIMVTVWQVLNARVRVNLFRYGIEVHIPFRTPLSLRWEDITGIASATIQDKLWGHILRTRHQLTIFLTQGKPITLDDHIHSLSEMTTRIKANLYPRLLPGYRARFQAGESLRFGPLSIQANTLSIRNRQIPWVKVTHITVSAGHLVVETHEQGSEHKKNIRIPITQIPNLELLFQVLQRGLNQQL
jgi:hypothetical protein